MKHTVSANESRNEWDYGFKTLPYEPQSLDITHCELPNGSELWHMHQFHTNNNGNYRSLHVSSDRGARITVKAFYSMIRELACEKNWNDFEKYAQAILEKRYGGFWRVYARI